MSLCLLIDTMHSLPQKKFFYNIVVVRSLLDCKKPLLLLFIIDTFFSVFLLGFCTLAECFRMYYVCYSYKALIHSSFHCLLVLSLLLPHLSFCYLNVIIKTTILLFICLFEGKQVLPHLSTC